MTFMKSFKTWNPEEISLFLKMLPQNLKKARAMARLGLGVWQKLEEKKKKDLMALIMICAINHNT